MTTTRFLTSIAAVGFASIALAAPSAAQGGVDQVFIDQVRQKGVPIASDAQATDLAHSTCGLLSNGGSPVDALTKITSATHWSQQQATDFGGLAVMAYCRDLMPQVLAQLQAPQAPEQSDAGSDSQAAPPTGPQLNVPKETDGPASLPLPPPDKHYPYGPRFGAR